MPAQEAVPHATVLDAELVKRRKDALVSALFSLSKAAGEASSATIDLIDLLQGAGHDTTALSNAFRGIPSSIVPAVDALAPVVTAAKPGPKSKKTQEIKSSQEPVSASQDKEDASEKPAKRAKRVKLPGEPKRPLPAQLTWMNEKRAALKGERESKGEEPLKRDEAWKVLLGYWNELPEDFRAKLEKEQKEKMEKYHEEVAKFKKLQESGAAPEPATSQSTQPAEKDTGVDTAGETAEQADTTETTTKSPTKRKKNRESKEKRHKKAA